MCATCVAQGVAYVGGALAGLQVMGARARARRLRSESSGAVDPPEAQAPVDRESVIGASSKAP